MAVLPRRQQESFVDAYTTEDEQVEAIKKWWRENGVAVVTGISLGLGGLFGWQFWQGKEAARSEAASVGFQTVMARQEDADSIAAQAAARQVLEQHGDSGYAPLAAMTLADAALNSDNPESAAAQLQWVIANTDEQALKAIARLRLARLQLAGGDAAAARGTLDGASLPDDDAVVRELSGDINVALDNTSAARADYLRALELLQGKGADGVVVEMKLDALGPAAPPS